LPLKDKAPIEERHECVDWFLKHPEVAEQVTAQLTLIGDLERIISKVATARISPKEVVQLKRALSAIQPIQEKLLKSGNPALEKIGNLLNSCPEVIEKIEKQLTPDPPFAVNKGNAIAEGVDGELDELRKIAYSGKDYLLQIQQRESERTSIPSLKIAFNNVYGYYLEVTHTHKDKVPADWMRKQTLTNAERYITEELKQYEEKILGAEEKILALETRLFNELVFSLMDYIARVQKNAQLLAQIDCFLSFASTALKNNYVRPHVNESKILDIKDGRHPVIEKQLSPGDEYIANDIYLDNETQQIIIITGPNMSGKSALLRQTALIVLMAQMGSFVPAKHAEIGLVDKLFTRVGASDNISAGESTFMVEMNETASILNNVSDRSLILLDEIGRGTSTYDGISIAWAIVEFLHEHTKAKAKTLFATHYHELNDLAASFRRVKNFNVSIKELEHKVLFMRKLVPGGSEHSFGIHVAQMAGMPRRVVERAKEILLDLEERNRRTGTGKEGSSTRSGNLVNAGNSTNTGISSHSGFSKTDGNRTGSKVSGVKGAEDMQLSFIQLNDPVLEQIKDDILNTDINNLTPVEALMKLNAISKLLNK